MCRYFSFTKMFLSIVVILASNQNIQEDIEKFMDGVQENINFYKEYAKDEASQDFTMLHIANYDIGLYDLCSIYQSVYRKLEAEEMVSVITVRNKFGSNLTPKEYLNDLMSSLRKYIYHEKYYKSLNSMELSVNFINQKHIIDFDMITTTDTMIGRVKREFNASVIEASIEIAYAIFCEIIKDSFENALIYVLNQVLQQNEDTSTDSYGDLIFNNLMRRLNPLRIENLSMAKLLTKPNSRLKVIFDVLCEKNVEYEKKLGFSYFTVHNDYAADLFASLLEKKHKKLIDGFIRSILHRHMMALEHPDNMESTVERFTITCDEIITCIGPIQKDSTSDVILSCYSGSLHKLLAEENFVDSFEFYFEYVNFHDLKVSLEDTYNQIVAKMCQELRYENTTRIVFNDMITPDSLHKLWRIFTRTNIINNTYHNQSIFIDNGKTLSAKKLAKSRMLESCIFNLMSKSTYAATDNITMEVFFTKREINEDCDDDRTESKIYKICTFRKPVKDHKILIGYIGNEGDKSIKIETHKCIVPDENLSSAIVSYIKQGTAMDIDIVSLHTILVSIDTTTTYIYIAHCAETDTGKEGILLTYNVQKTDESENYADLGYPDRRFRCFYNVSGSLLNELNKHLRYLHLSAGNELKIPNLLLMDEIEMFYTEKVITMEQFLCSIKYSNFIRTKPDKIQDFCDTTLMLSYKELLDYGNIINVAKEKQIAEFAKELGFMEEDFYRILNKLILGIDCRENTEDCHYTIDEDETKKTYDLCTTYHPNGNKVLHVCDVHFQNDQHFFTVNLTDVLHKILENEDVSKMLSTLSLEAETSCGARTVTMLLNIMCKEINYYDTFYRKFNSDAKDKIEERLVKVVAEYLSCKQQLYEPSPHMVFTDTQKEFFHMFTQKYKEECLKKLVEMIHTELSEQARKKMVKIISLIPLRKSTLLCDIDVVENAGDDNFVNLQNFEYQDCHKLQEPTKK